MGAGSRLVGKIIALAISIFIILLMLQMWDETSGGDMLGSWESGDVDTGDMAFFLVFLFFVGGLAWAYAIIPMKT